MADFVRMLVDDGSSRAVDLKDKGWRLRLLCEEGETTAELFEEQTFPERVHRPDANHIRAQNRINLTNAEQRWLRDALTEMLGEPVDTAALHDEIAKLRAGIPQQINAVFEAAIRFGVSTHTGDANCCAGDCDDCEARPAEADLRALVMSIVSDETKKRVEAQRAG